MARKRGGQIVVAIAGAYTLDAGVVAMHLLLGEKDEGGWAGLSRLPVGTKVLLRHPLSGGPGPLEAVVADLCEKLSVEVEWRTPEPGQGGLGTIHRDEAMVEDADAVVTYVDHRRNDETSGTVRLTRMAMHRAKHVWSFAPIEDEVAYAGASERVPVWAS
jgi:hypothetical protein